MEISVWIGNLGKYNEGILQGDWFTLPVPFSEVAEKVGLNSGYEEYAIFDYEAPFKISEYEGLARLNEIAENMDSVYDYLWENADDLIPDYYDDIEEIIDNPNKVTYLAGVTNDEELGEYVLEHHLWYDIDDKLVGYLDEDRIGRDVHLAWFNGTYAKTGYFYQS
jgi:hypothetical protein